MDLVIQEGERPTAFCQDIWSSILNKTDPEALQKLSGVCRYLYHRCNTPERRVVRIDWPHIQRLPTLLADFEQHTEFMGPFGPSAEAGAWESLSRQVLDTLPERQGFRAAAAQQSGSFHFVEYESPAEPTQVWLLHPATGFEIEITSQLKTIGAPLELFSNHPIFRRRNAVQNLGAVAPVAPSRTTCHVLRAQWKTELQFIVSGPARATRHTIKFPQENVPCPSTMKRQRTIPLKVF